MFLRKFVKTKFDTSLKGYLSSSFDDEDENDCDDEIVEKIAHDTVEAIMSSESSNQNNFEIYDDDNEPISSETIKVTSNNKNNIIDDNEFSKNHHFVKNDHENIKKLITNEINTKHFNDLSDRPQLDIKRKKTDTETVNDCIIEFLKSRIKPEQENYRRHFLLSLLPDIEQMNNTQFRHFRRKVDELIDDILEK